jgi:solute carrier family 9 (sodium/hydrogen exchanger), member 6/7
MLFWAGLRGAVGVALAAGLDDPNSSPTLKATVLIVVVLTVIIFGGTTARMLEIVGVRTNVVDEEDEDEDEDDFFDDVEHHWTSVPSASRVNGTTSTQSIPLETTAAVNRANQPYPQRNKSAPSPDPFSVQVEEISDNESTASDLPPRARLSPSGLSPNRSHSATPTGGTGRLARMGNMLGATLDERAKWFLEFDQNVLKPLVQNSDETSDRER